MRDSAFKALRAQAYPCSLAFSFAAAQFLTAHGVPEDLEILVPLSDFWTGDRENHYWLQSAVAAIRRRHGYDLNGPIEGRPVP